MIVNGHIRKSYRKPRKKKVSNADIKRERATQYVMEKVRPPRG